VGANKTGEVIITKLKQDRSFGLLPIALFDDDPQTWGTSIQGLWVYGPLSLAADFRKQSQIAVVATVGLEKQRIVSVIEGLAFPTVLLVPDLAGLQSLWTVSRDLG